MKLTQEGNGRTRREDYPNLYEFRRENLWMEVKEVDDEKSVKVVSFFKQKSRGDPVEVTGVEFKPPVRDFDRVCDVKSVIALMEDLMFTKAVSGASGRKKRTTLRKSMESLKPHEEYMLISLIDYIRQCVREGSEKCLLTSAELSFILPKQTGSKGKKQ